MRIRLTLPAEDRQALVRSFWFTVSVLAALPGVALAWWLQSAPFLAAGLGAGLLVGSIAVIHEDTVWRVYRTWNRRVVHPIGSLAAALVMRICFFIVLVAVGRAGSRMPVVHGASSSAWRPRGSLPADAYGSLFAAAAAGGATAAWVPAYVSWARQTGNLWGLSLLPFLAILKLLPREEERSPQANIYTLF